MERMKLWKFVHFYMQDAGIPSSPTFLNLSNFLASDAVLRKRGKWVVGINWGSLVRTYRYEIGTTSFQGIIQVPVLGYDQLT